MTEEDLEKLRKKKVIPALRRVSRWWQPKQDAMRAAKVGPNKYICQSCGDIVDGKTIKMDHIHPVVNPKYGFETWEIYIKRMFCDGSGFQALCGVCHDTKSQIEGELRKKYRAKRKKAIKK